MIRREIGPRYVLNEVIKLPYLLTMLGSLGKKMLIERVVEAKLEEWLKLIVNDMKQM